MLNENLEKKFNLMLHKIIIFRKIQKKAKSNDKFEWK
jgi:hypothetical protein